MKPIAIFAAVLVSATAVPREILAQGGQTGGAWCGADHFRGTPQQVANHQLYDSN